MKNDWTKYHDESQRLISAMRDALEARWEYQQDRIAELTRRIEKLEKGRDES